MTVKKDDLHGKVEYTLEKEIGKLDKALMRQLGVSERKIKRKK
jgi:hypothetical protein